MNTLSWLIYAADVASALNFWSGFVAFAGAPASIAAFAWVNNQDRWRWDSQMREHRAWPSLFAKPEGDRPPALRPFASYAKPLIGVAVCAGLIAAAVPGRDTIYAIAASEMGEEVAKSETAGKAMRALNAWLDKQISNQRAQ